MLQKNRGGNDAAKKSWIQRCCEKVPRDTDGRDALTVMERDTVSVSDPVGNADEKRGVTLFVVVCVITDVENKSHDATLYTPP